MSYREWQDHNVPPHVILTDVCIFSKFGLGSLPFQMQIHDKDKADLDRLLKELLSEKVAFGNRTGVDADIPFVQLCIDQLGVCSL